MATVIFLCALCWRCRVLDHLRCIGRAVRMLPNYAFVTAASSPFTRPITASTGLSQYMTTHPFTPRVHRACRANMTRDEAVPA